MMSVEGPLIAAVIARMADPKLNLAAYGIAFAFALIIEAPVIMMLSASTALVHDAQSFHKLRKFTYLLNITITLVMLILLIPVIFNYILGDMMHLSEKLISLTYSSLFILLIWPGAIGYRRFYQGILIRYGHTRRVAYGTVIRLAAMSITVLVLFILDVFPGAYIGAAALSIGVLFEAIASKMMVRKTLYSLLKQSEIPDSGEDLTYRGIMKFYYPLALTSILGLVIQPALTFFMGQGRNALESLAVWPVVNSFVFIFRSFGLSYQEVAISLMGANRENYRKLKTFAQIIALSVCIILAIIALTPLLKYWMVNISGLTEMLALFSYWPVRVLILMPALSVWISFQRAVLVVDRKTGPITSATSIELLLVVLLMFVLIFHSAYSAVTVAAVALMIGRGGAIGYLWSKILKVKV